MYMYVHTLSMEFVTMKACTQLRVCVHTYVQLYAIFCRLNAVSSYMYHIILPLQFKSG